MKSIKNWNKIWIGLGWVFSHIDFIVENPIEFDMRLEMHFKIKLPKNAIFRCNPRGLFRLLCIRFDRTLKRSMLSTLQNVFNFLELMTIAIGPSTNSNANSFFFIFNWFINCLNIHLLIVDCLAFFFRCERCSTLYSVSRKIKNENH